MDTPAIELTMPQGPVPFDPENCRCSAVHAEWLRRVRDQRLYKTRFAEWDEFCSTGLGVNELHIRRILALLAEFGRDYFVLAELVPVTGDEYRPISRKVRRGALCVDGAAIVIRPENTERLATLVEKLKKVRKERRQKKTEEAPATDRIALLDQRCRQVTTEFRRLAVPKAAQNERQQLGAILRRTLSALGRVEMEIGIY